MITSYIFTKTVGIRPYKKEEEIKHRVIEPLYYNWLTL